MLTHCLSLSLSQKILGQFKSAQTSDVFILNEMSGVAEPVRLSYTLIHPEIPSRAMQTSALYTLFEFEGETEACFALYVKAQRPGI